MPRSQASPLILRRGEQGQPGGPGPAEQQGTGTPGRTSFGPGRLLERLRLGVNTAWFPWVLAAIGFMDYFTFCGVVLTPLLTLGLVAATSLSRMVLLCTTASCGFLAGSFAFAFALDWLGLHGKLADSAQLAMARSLLQRHGLLAGLFNTLLPLPTMPLIVAARAVDANVPAILMSMAAGRTARYVALVGAVCSSRSMYTRGTRCAGASASVRIAEGACEPL